MPQKPNCSIVIIHWQTEDFLNKQLRSLETDDQLQIIVVDNNSITDTQSWQRKYPQIQFLFLDKNYGFGTAGNRGAEQAQAEWILFLNPDVVIRNNDIQSMIEYAKKQNLVAVSADLDDDNYRKPVPTFLSLLIEFSPLHRLVPLEYLNNSRTLVGGCFLIKRNVFLDMGKWDERFFLWFEDSDLSKRLLDANQPYGFLKTSVIHEGGVSFKQLSTSKKKKIFFKSMEIYAKKHFNKLEQFLLHILTKRFAN